MAKKAPVVLNKKLLTEKVAEAADLSKKASKEIVDLVFAEMTENLKKGGKVEISGFGKFEVKKRKARKGINPATKEAIKIPATKVPSFKAAKALKDSVK